MRYLFLVILFVSCASRKQMIREYVDEVIRERINVENNVIRNKTLDNNLTISFRVNEYDTSGRIIKETIADVKEERKEENRDSITQQIDKTREVERDIKVDLKDNKVSRTNNFLWGMIVSLIIVIAIFIAIRFKR